MKEVVKIWFERLYKEEIENIEGTISNERLWKKGSKDEEEVVIHTLNIEELEEYLGLLKEKLHEVEKIKPED